MNKLRLMTIVLSMATSWAWSQQDTSITQSAQFEGDLKIRLRDAGKISSNPVVIEQKSKMDKNIPRQRHAELLSSRIEKGPGDRSKDVVQSVSAARRHGSDTF